MPRPHWSFSIVIGAFGSSFLYPRHLCLGLIEANVFAGDEKVSGKDVSEAFMPRPHWSAYITSSELSSPFGIRGIYASASLKHPGLIECWYCLDRGIRGIYASASLKRGTGGKRNVQYQSYPRHLCLGLIEASNRAIRVNWRHIVSEAFMPRPHWSKTEQSCSWR